MFGPTEALHPKKSLYETYKLRAALLEWREEAQSLAGPHSPHILSVGTFAEQFENHRCGATYVTLIMLGVLGNPPSSDLSLQTPTALRATVRSGVSCPHPPADGRSW